MFSCGIVEDEPNAMERMKRILKEIDSSIDILFESYNCEDFIEKANSIQPEVLFLDINVGDKLIFEVLGKLVYSPHVVFVTAYDEYTIKAFEEGAIDYVLKPVSKERLSKTIERISKIGVKKYSLQYYIQQLSKLPVKHGDEILLIEIKEIIYLEAENRTVRIITKDGRFECSTPLHTLMNKLPATDFIQVHKSYVISIKHISKIKKWFQGSYIIVLDNGDEVNLSRNYKPEFFRRIGFKE
ncbi:two component transcriptional regulator, LytTR family [Fervidobacterium changbaicum]|uniref:LytTR family DNA-binding domain-containing protein n=2 Tax=Fervidobacterium TaxID=2422 RepID=A0AAI8CL19_FERIS|nr:MULTISPECIES: LytTR family DNA-binding domain-containing protein [Fervidobacterium]AMW32560.1 LytTR family DNA-binding domain-containing protein [Fervidobacterium islandicum]QAV32590.1 DNA-binding response regulator [Fervidobacterium changbaicum]SDH65924.1 two component transcriptional regulator, LytTR family [Fervidobacterium changbaicum]